MKKYFNYYPRNFANEYTTIYVETAEEEQQLKKWYEERGKQGSSLDRVTVKELRAMTSTEKFTRKTNEAFSGWCRPWQPMSVIDFLNPYKRG